MKNIFLLFLTLLFTNLGFGQDLDQSEEVVEKISTYASAPPPISDNWSKKLDQQYFFEANDLDANYLLRGDVSGLLLTKPNGNPQEPYRFKSRGMTTFGRLQSPLILLDGFPVSSMESVDPMDIKSIEVIHDLSLAAQYGLQGSNGIIQIHTIDKNEDESIIRRLNYKAFGTLDIAQQNVEILNTDEFIGRGGFDRGNQTNWWKEITQPGLSMAHHLSLSQKTNKTKYELSGNYRKGANTLLNTGYDQGTLRAYIDQYFFKNRLHYNAQISATSRNVKPGLKEAYRYAAKRNPTAPVYDSTVPEYGGFQETGYFDYYNPVSIVEQNQPEVKSSTQRGFFNLDFRIFRNFKIGTNLSATKNFYLRKFHSPETSLYIGGNVSGRAIWTEYTQNSNFLNTYLEYQPNDFNIRLGYRLQNHEENSIAAEVIHTGNSDFNFFDFESQVELGENNPALNFYKNHKSNHRLDAIYGTIEKEFDDKLAFKIHYSKEGSSRLGANKKWGNYGGIHTEVRLHNFFKNPTAKINLFTGYGIAANLPDRQDLSNGSTMATSILTFQEGELLYSVFGYQQANPNLRSEVSKEWNIGFRIPRKNWDISLAFFNKRSTDLIESDRIPVILENMNLIYVTQYSNYGEINNNGLEVDINTDFRLTDYTENFDVQWLSHLQLSTFKTTVAKKRNPINYPSSTSYLNINIPNQEEIGVINGPVYTGVDNFGNIILEDINQDGSHCYCTDDYIELGNTLPALNIGWQNKFKFYKLEVLINLYSSIGHHLINQEVLNNAGSNSVFNVPSITYDGLLQDISTGAFANIYFEKASFLRFENISFRYPFITKNDSKITAFVGFNNLFTIHNYSGVNPEVRLDLNGDGLVHGFDLTDNYTMTKSFVVGIEVDFLKKKAFNSSLISHL